MSDRSGLALLIGISLPFVIITTFTAIIIGVGHLEEATFGSVSKNWSLAIALGGILILGMALDGYLRLKNEILVTLGLTLMVPFTALCIVLVLLGDSPFSAVS